MKGFGTKKDLAEAERWLKRAMEKSEGRLFHDAKRLLDEIEIRKKQK